jgi:hypothetical protein
MALAVTTRGPLRSPYIPEEGRDNRPSGQGGASVGSGAQGQGTW